ncbi:methyltransferase RsmF C-terminal domain-like protein [Mucilaginibacter sp. FT3.2]|uniref:methyltransferase RsmF C-terminal domain-like protein n=1 Tax=Mucilaginibacter sp. FT3.2 TaxID=2723090 RepID=UPI0016199E09|nr:RNA methyltransferase [Mucilaginibacter sp. FT3.2]MBB6235367.1 16S rRNA C967 or C1407 C5-methylase (RsmB/RsmF family)/NOL1/NOP2/fmu family ribosome biogenesis protein [Mucilaginibacter sp. FT3.2]
MNDHRFPHNFLQSLSAENGFNEEKFINAHQITDAPTSIRLNPFKPSVAKTDEQVPWCANGFYLNSRPSFTFDPLFHAGCYYVQEASSMFIDHIFKNIRPNIDDAVKVLDLCAAPGGKSTLLNSAINANDLLVANEIIKTRVPVLTDNLSRWGQGNVIVSNNDPKDIGRLKSFFDIILVDAPCSGSGMFRKDPQAMNEWSEANVELCHQRQERILADILPALKEDGYLIYSTCSYSHQENEDILDWLCQEFDLESIRIPIYKEWGIVETQSTSQKAWGYRFYPGQVKGEGLFASCLKKRTSTGELGTFKNNMQQKISSKEIDQVKAYINNPDDFYYFKVNEDWLAINRAHKEDLNILQRHLYLKKSGVRVGKLMGKDLIPDHELALSTILNKDAVLQTELTYDQAIQYLRRDNIDLNPAEKGWSLMNFKGQPLGWAKLLPNRINNYYPKEIRIFSSPSPQAP